MSWFLSLITAVLTGLVGLLSAGLVANAYAVWYNVPTREGAAGFFVVGMALLGGVLGAFVGFLSSRWIASSSFLKALGCSSAIVIGVAALVLLVCYIFADIPPKIAGDELQLEVEWRLPADQKIPEGELEPILGSVINGVERKSRHGTFDVTEARQESDRWIIPGEIFLFTTRGGRLLRVESNRTNDLGAFLVPLPARPGPEHESWSDWHPRQSPDGSPWPYSKPSYRFKVHRIPPPPPPPTDQELKAQKESEEAAAYQALGTNPPLHQLIPYTESWRDQRHATDALKRISGRPELPVELSALMLDTDSRQASDAMLLVGRLPDPPADLVPGTQAAGRDIIERLKKFNATPTEADPSFEGAADVGLRFHGWMEAVRTLRQKHQGDFIPQLQEVLQLSRVRTESHVIQMDVRRVASYYLREWAGVQPLPGDPPPK